MYGTQPRYSIFAVTDIYIFDYRLAFFSLGCIGRNIVCLLCFSLQHIVCGLFWFSRFDEFLAFSHKIVCIVAFSPS